MRLRNFVGQREMAVDEKEVVRLYFRKLCRQAVWVFLLVVGAQEA